MAADLSDLKIYNLLKADIVCGYCAHDLFSALALALKCSNIAWEFRGGSHANHSGVNGLKYSCKYKSQKFVFCMHFFIDGIESAWQAGYFLSLGNQTDYGSLCVVSEKDFLTGLEVTIPSSHIFQVTGLTFLP